MEKCLKYLIWFGIFITLLIPFVIIKGTFFPFITGKAFFFRILVEIIFGLYLILIIKYEEYRLKWSWILGSLGLFVLILFLADLNAVSPYKAFWGNFERMEGWVTFIHLFLYFIVLGTMFKTEKIWLWFFRASLFAGFVMGITSISEGIKENIIRIVGPLGNPIYISVYFLFIFFLTLILLYKDVLAKKISDWSSVKKVFGSVLFYIYIIMAGVSFFVVYRTSRGALLGLVGGVFLSAILVSLFEKKKVIRQISNVGIISVVIVVLIFLGARNTSFVKTNPTLSRLASISWSNINGQARQLVWPMALKGFKEKPILGWGQEGFNYVFNKYYDPKMYNQELWFDRAHNAPLDFLVAGGILGFVSYLSLFFVVLYWLWFRHNSLEITEKALLSGALAGYFFQAIFVFDNLISYLMFVTILAYIHSCSVEESEKLKKKNDGNSMVIKNYFSYLSKIVSDEEYQNYILIPLVVTLTIIGIWWINVPTLKANQALIVSLDLVRNGQALDGLNDFKLALSFKSLGDSEIREQLISNSLMVIKNSRVDQSVKEEFFTFAMTEINKQISQTPSDVRYYYLAGSLLSNIGAHEQALPYIKKAIELSPLKQQMRFELIQALYSLEKSTEAMIEAKSAYELEPNYDQAKNVYQTTVKNEIKENPAFKTEGEKILKDLAI